jgi:hypothetical protein
VLLTLAVIGGTHVGSFLLPTITYLPLPLTYCPFLPLFHSSLTLQGSVLLTLALIGGTHVGSKRAYVRKRYRTAARVIGAALFCALYNAQDAVSPLAVLAVSTAYLVVLAAVEFFGAKHKLPRLVE